MKQLLSLLLVLCIPAFALADSVRLGDPLSGTVCWPEDTSEKEAIYIYRYALPCAVGDSVMDEGVNAFFQDFLDDAIAFTVPINGESVEDTSVQSSTDVDFQITCNNDDAFSVLMTTHTLMDGYDFTVYSARVFAARGLKEGLVVPLPYLLGILDGGETDTWLEDRQTAKADKCVRDILWEQIEENREHRDYLPDITYDYFQEMFYPEEDFYLDETGNPVFFIQPGVLTPEEDGVLLFPVDLDYILDEI